jgi:hypothetical protein
MVMLAWPRRERERERQMDMDGSTRRPAVDRVPNSDFVPPGCVRRRTEIQERSGSPAGAYAAAVGGRMRPSRFASSLLYYYPFRNQE